MEQRNTQSSEQFAFQDFLSLISRLFDEIKKDWPFFSFCGFLVSSSVILRGQLEAFSGSLGADGSRALMLDFFPIRAFFFIILIFWCLGAVSSLLNNWGWPWAFLDGVVHHIELRFLQLTSSILCFCLGVAAYAMFHSALISSPDGIILFRLVLVVCLLLTGFFIIVSSAYRLLPFIPWPWGLVFLIGTIIIFVLLIMHDLPSGQPVPSQALLRF